MVSDLLVELGGLSFHYRHWGGRGRPVVLLHGLASTSHIWDLTAPLLARRFRVVALDQRGHGESAKPDHGYDFDTVTGDLRAFVAALEFERPVLVGHSWGASVALRYAAGHPDGVPGLVLVDGGVIDLSAVMTWEQAEEEMTPPPIDGVPAKQLLAAVRGLAYFREIWSPEFERMFLTNFEVREDGTIWRRLPVEHHMKVVRALYDLSPSQLLPLVQSPVLIVVASRKPQGEREERWQRYRREGLESAARLLRQCETVVMEDTIHDIPVHRPRELAAAIERFAGGLA
ncbi:MAG: alpha/beta hydrolase [Chloroflexi bacterium]|nr:alpha/beta hydrolase [Chloroflexota bacterium]